MKKRKRRLKKRVVVFIVLFILILIPILTKKEKPKNIEEKKTTKTEDVLSKLDLDNYSKLYNITNDYVTIIKNNTINLVDLKNEALLELNDLINDLDHFKLVIDHLLHQKYNLSKADELMLKTPIYMLKEHELIVYFDEYNSSDNLTVNYNEVKEYLKFNPTFDLNYEIEDNYELDPNKITIALTFDDGPNGKRTLELIDFLEKNNCAATFFNVGNKLKNGKTAVLKVYNSHSEIAYHSYKHAYLTKQTATEIQEEFKKSDDLLFDITGSHFKLIRPPYGAYNDEVVSTLPLSYILWNLDTNDWKYRDANHAKEYVMKNYKDGAIILFHDSYNDSVEAVKMIVPLLKEKGVQITSVSRLAKLKGINLENNTVYKSLT